ncbi:nif-specific transcriptional activator NifA [Methylomagnum ishizawai]|uniref:Nif-specific regulatory protein n=1 Tax=Methylomagnum ishizawai TaxID=1760988 RepID=A0A1Y6D9Y6_9GAMM|nr:nif-specific transcriptional activator NifA [Methylomagnum ishizawai]BBL76247.1 sigma-54-dependent Fis family transcriptional regulator [Methylomagnum ishizawai]SMF96525.1 Nif-specific regulatory protein [Methylomagnum ishizawai]
MVERTELVEHELDALYQVSRVLNGTLSLQDKLRQVLEVLHQRAGMRAGLITLRELDSDALSVCAVHREGGEPLDDKVSYQPGEGLVGAILDKGDTLIVERLAEEPRFLGKLKLYDPELPFIGSPIHVGDNEMVGVLAAQPVANDWLRDRARFMEMVANLIAQSAGLLRSMEQKQRDLAMERDQLKQTLRKNYRFENIIGHAQPMMRVLELVRQVSKWNTTVLIRGESGTGKEVIANAIHYNSACANGPFLRLNCAALPDNLLESELFGHEKGAFSGAVTLRKGRFELAHNGTLFLDEIGEISPAFQAKLLRVIQEGEFERVGGSQTLKVNVRIIAATNRDLEYEVDEGRFREDLYYRLNVMPIHLPPLRERLEDIPELARFLLGRISKQQGGRPLELKESAIRLLMRYSWPGNVRELENRIERAAIMSPDGVIDRDVLALSGFEDDLNTPAPKPSSASSKEATIDFTDESLDERERVIAALEQSGWVQAKAARLLNMTPRQIAYRVQTLNIKMKRI